MCIEDTFGRVSGGLVQLGTDIVNVPELIGRVVSCARKDCVAIVVDIAGGLVESGCTAGVAKSSNGE